MLYNWCVESNWFGNFSIHVREWVPGEKTRAHLQYGTTAHCENLYALPNRTIVWRTPIVRISHTCGGQTGFFFFFFPLDLPFTSLYQTWLEHSDQHLDLTLDEQQPIGHEHCRTPCSQAYSELFGLAGGLADGQMMLRPTLRGNTACLSMKIEVEATNMVVSWTHKTSKNG